MEWLTYYLFEVRYYSKTNFVFIDVLGLNKTYFFFRSNKRFIYFTEAVNDHLLKFGESEFN